MATIEPNTPDYSGQRAVFNEISHHYDRYRPTYPPELAHEILAYSRLNSDGKMLEIGSGTGKGTELFAAQGYAIHCLEPGANLSGIAAKKFADFPNVTFENTTFENWTLTPETYDVVFAAQSFHWVPAEMGLRKAADSLKPNGTLSLFWNMSPWQDYVGYAEIQEVYERFAPTLSEEVRRKPREWDMERRAEQIRNTQRFSEVKIEQFPWTARYSSADYVALLDTHSNHLMLPAETRERLYGGITQVLEKHGGTIEKHYTAVLYLARKA